MTEGTGFTVMVKEVDVPVQVLPELENSGVTVMVAVTGAVVPLVAVKDAISPVPPAPRPMVISEFVQLYSVPATFPEKVTMVDGAALHNVWFTTAFTVGMGFTVIVNEVGVPVQVIPPLVYWGVAVMVAVTGAFVMLVAAKDPILPVPLAARPIVVLSLTQL